MVHYFILAEQQKRKETKAQDIYSKTDAFHMFGVSSTGYYNWVFRYEDRDGKRKEKKLELKTYQEKFTEIIGKLGFVPGKKTFRTHMWRTYGIDISVKKAKKIMNSMGLIANKPKKDAYKGQATHYHVCAAKQNHINQNFKLGPRQIILTDITYLYYGKNRKLIYLCVFRDAYTNEILGYALSLRMNVELVKAAYEMMMSKHKDELKKAICYIHSDQGSQYLSCEFQELLENEGFVQSMSNRGNSLDNAPMESFFGRMKTEALELIARCPTVEVVKKLIAGYMDSYNTVRYQYNLAGLTPKEYYQYCLTNIYPLDNYFGVEATELMSIEQLVEAKMEKQRAEKEKKKKRRQERKEKQLHLLKNPFQMMINDSKKVKKELHKWLKSKAIAEMQIEKLNEILDKIELAKQFYKGASKEIKENLKEPQFWKLYAELDYVNDIPALY